MALALRLTVLSHVVAQANARWFQTGSSAGDWSPATPTVEPATLSPDGLIPKTTSAPRRRPFDWDLRRRDGSSPTICGYPVDDLDGPPITCGRGEYCGFDRFLGVVGCCTETNPRGCVVPTTCLESSRSAQWSGDSLTTYCGNSARPHCVTRSYDANFYEPLYGASFVGCAARPASGDIVASSASVSDVSSTVSFSTFTTTDGTVTTTVTVSFPGDSGPSTTASPSSGGNSGSRNVGAIVGGVVGGVAGLALIIAAIVFILYRRKKRPKSPDPFTFGQPKIPPDDHHIYPQEPIPGSQYPSSFFGEAPPGMAQISEQQPVITYPPNAYGIQNPTHTAGHSHNPNHNPGHDYNHNYNYNTEAPAYHAQQAVPSKPQDDAVSPIEESPVSPVSPAENYNTMVSALTNHSPPLQPLQPAVFRPQSEYAQYSPPPPAQYHSYQPYPGT